MAERPEDLNLPITVVQRLIKESLPDGVIVAKEARQTISRASSVFILYLTSCAVAHANKAKRKTLAVNDILAALNDMEFDSFVPPLNESLKFRKDFLAQSANSKKQTKPAAKTAIAEEVDDEMEETGDGLVDMEADNDEEEEDEEAVVDDEDTNDKLKDSLDTSKRTNKKRKLETDETAANDDYVEVEESASNSSVSSSNSLAAAD